jgi:type I restriction enzyme M protein
VCAGRIGDISVFGQESNPATWRMARMNLAIRGIEANLGAQNADTFHADLYRDLKADYILAHPLVIVNCRPQSGHCARTD